MRYIISVIIALLLFTSCDHKELCYHHPHTAKVRFDVDWSEFEEETPTGMTVMIYPQSGGKPLRHLTNTISHAIVDLEAGKYNSIVYNQSDTEFGSVMFAEMDDFYTAEVRTVEDESRWYTCRADNEKLAVQPEWVGTDCYTDAEVTPQMVEAAGDEYIASISQASQTRTQYVIASHTPKNIIHTIYIKVYIKGIYNLRSARASLTGLAEGYSFSQARTTDSQVTQLIEQWQLTADKNDPTQGYITAKITTMGLPYGHAEKPDDNEFNLSLLLVDNETIIDVPFKVGDKLRKIQNDEGEYILAFELELTLDDVLPDVKPSGSGEGGFKVTVDDWGEEQNVDINM